MFVSESSPWKFKFSFFDCRRWPVVKGHVTKQCTSTSRRLGVLMIIIMLPDAEQKGNLDICWATFFLIFWGFWMLAAEMQDVFTLLEVRWSAIDKLMTLVPILNYHWIGMQTIEKKYFCQWELRFINCWIRLCQRYFEIEIFWQLVTSRFFGTANTSWWSTHQSSW
jgi:hypothetical protein